MAEQRGEDWRIWRGGGPSQGQSVLYVWNTPVRTALNHFNSPNYSWGFSFEARRKGIITVLGDCRLASNPERGNRAYLTRQVAATLLQKQLQLGPGELSGRTVLILSEAIIWTGGNSAEYKDGYRIALSKEQREVLSIWLDEQETRLGGLGGFAPRGFAPPPKPPGLAALQLDDEDYELLLGQRPMTARERATFLRNEETSQGFHQRRGATNEEENAKRFEYLKSLRNDPTYREQERKKNAARMNAYRQNPETVEALRERERRWQLEYQRNLRAERKAQGLTSKGTPPLPKTPKLTPSERTRRWRLGLTKKQKRRQK